MGEFEVLTVREHAGGIQLKDDPFPTAVRHTSHLSSPSHVASPSVNIYKCFGTPHGTLVRKLRPNTRSKKNSLGLDRMLA